MSAFFFKPKNWQQSFSVPWKFHRQHFQVMLTTFFLSSQESAFCTPLHFNSYSQQQPCQQTPDKFTKLISIFKTQRKSSLMQTFYNQLSTWVNSLFSFTGRAALHDLIYVRLFYSLLFCFIQYLAILLLFQHFDKIAQTPLSNAVSSSVEVSLWLVLKIN